MQELQELGIKPLKVAQYFIDQCDISAGDSVTHLKIQKLLYYTQAWGLVIIKKSFFKEKFQAWAHGPVLPSVYKDLKFYGFANIAGEKIAEYDTFPDGAASVLSEVWGAYGELSAKHLELLTHQEFPWNEARGNIPPDARSDAEINPDTMIDYYSKLQRNG